MVLYGWFKDFELLFFGVLMEEDVLSTFEGAFGELYGRFVEFFRVSGMVCVVFIVVLDGVVINL